MNPMRSMQGRPSSRAWLLACVLGCGEPHWQQLRWPITDGDLTELPPQPVGESVAAGVGLQAQAMTWESDAVVVELQVTNLGDGVLTIERGLIMLAWDDLEYAPDRSAREGESDPPRLELAAREQGLLQLRYATGRPLLDSGARLIVRKLERDGVAVIELPELALPASPAR